MTIQAFSQKELSVDLDNTAKTLDSKIANNTLSPEQVVLRYGELLNQKNIEQIIGLYHDDAEIIPDQLKSLSGKDAIIEFYKSTFQSIELNGKLKIHSVDIDRQFAIIRCEEPAEIKDLSSGITSQSYFREIFVLKYMEGKWLIYRYMFSQNPHQGMD